MAGVSAQWVILGRVPILGPDNSPADTGDFSLELASRPRVTILTVARRVHPERNLPDLYPYLIAVDIAGLLFHFSVAPNIGAEFNNFPGSSYLIMVSGLFHPASTQGRTSTGTATRIPDRTHPMPSIANIGNVGLLTVRGDYIIAELQAIEGTNSARLLCFRSRTDGWVERQLPYPLAGQPRPWVPNGVISFVGSLWWVDLSWGLLSCDPSADRPALLFLPLPRDSILPETTPDIDTIRCVRVSRYMLRFVEIIGRGGAARVRMWTLAPGLIGMPAQWYRLYDTRFADIWENDSYRATRLPEEVPALALVDPWNPEVVYFFLEQRLFGIHVPACRVVVFTNEANGLAPLPWEPPASGRYVLAWDLPPYVGEDLNEEVITFEEGSASSAPTPK